MKRSTSPSVLDLYRWLLRTPKPAPHPVMAELRLCLQRIAITWRLHRINVQERRAAVELAFERAHVIQASQNFNALLMSNQQLRESYRKRMEVLMEAGDAQ